MVVMHKARQLWKLPQHILCALLNLQVIPSWFQQVLGWILVLGAPVLIGCGLLIFRCLLAGSVVLLAWGEGALAFMFLLVALEAFSLLLLVRISPLLEEEEDCVCQKQTSPIPVQIRQCKAAPSAVRQESARRQSLSKPEPQRRLSQVLPPLARQIARAEDLAKIEQKTPSEVHRARALPIEHIPTILLNLPKSHVYMSALRGNGRGPVHRARDSSNPLPDRGG